MHEETKNIDFPSLMGFNSTSEMGFDVFACSVFLFGCNLRCPYCMNGRLVVEKESDWKRPVKVVPISSVKKYVEENNVSWIMISGGEPTLTPIKKLINLIHEFKIWGCKVGMSTNGLNPEILDEILPLLNYVALDFKTDKSEIYKELEVRSHKKEEAFKNLFKSINLLREEKQGGFNFDYEIRTTMYPAYFDIDSIPKMGKYLNRNEKWVFQQFRHAKNMLDEELALKQIPFGKQYVEEVKMAAKQYSDFVHIRYV